jgi:hypothetical protein
MAKVYRWYRVLENDRGEPELCCEAGALGGTQIQFCTVSAFSGYKKTGQAGRGVYFRSPGEAVTAYIARLEAANRVHQRNLDENRRKMAAAAALLVK